MPEGTYAGGDLCRRGLMPEGTLAQTLFAAKPLEGAIWSGFTNDLPRALPCHIKPQ
jgi:hypothetical protein